MKILSLFDGMSCGQIALKELGHDVIYYASEIDKHAIKQTQLNFSDTVQLGSVTEWQTWNIDWSTIDLILAGSPCQGFSFAGKQLAFDDPRSKLFFVFVEILNYIKKLNPDVKFLLENVNMKKEYLRVISEYVGVFPVNINSNLVSAQNRDRWYWTNIRTKQVGLFGELYVDIPQPKDRGFLLKDILDSEVDEKYFLSDKMLNGLINHSDKKQSEGCGFKFEPKDQNKKGNAITQRCYKMGVDDNYIVAMRGRNPDNPSDRRTGSPTEQRLEPKTDGKTNCLTSIAKDNLVMCLTPKRTEYGKQIRKQYESGEVSAMRKEVSSLEPREDGKTNTITTVQKDNLVIQLNPSKESGGNQPYQHNRVYDTEGIAPCLNTDARSPGVLTQSRIRRLTPTECARLQTIPDWYKWECSDTQIYRMCGNGWTVEVIKWILSFM